MLRLVTPDLFVESVAAIDPAMLRERGVEGLVMDLDCTLCDWRATSIPPSTRVWIDGMRSAGLRLCILSNGGKARVTPLADQLGIPCVTRAAKPLTYGLHAALAKLGLPADRVAVIGDQLFTDVMVGRLAGATTILVRPTSDVEAWVTRIKRPLERVILRRLAISGGVTKRYGAVS